MGERSREDTHPESTFVPVSQMKEGSQKLRSSIGPARPKTWRDLMGSRLSENAPGSVSRKGQGVGGTDGYQIAQQAAHCPDAEIMRKSR